MTSFIPILGRVVIKRDVAPEKKGSIIVPEVAKEAPAEGTVVAVASDVPDHLSIGTKVIFSKYAGQEMVLDGEKVLVVKVVDVIGYYK